MNNQSSRKQKQHVVPKFRRYEVEKNNLRNLIKNYSLFNLIWTVPLFLITLALESCFYLVTSNLGMIKVVWKSVLWNILNIKDTWKQRHIVQSRRQIGDKYILHLMNFSINKVRALIYVGLPKFK